MKKLLVILFIFIWTNCVFALNSVEAKNDLVKIFTKLQIPLDFEYVKKMGVILDNMNTDDPIFNEIKDQDDNIIYRLGKVKQIIQDEQKQYIEGRPFPSLLNNNDFLNGSKNNIGIDYVNSKIDALKDMYIRHGYPEMLALKLAQTQFLDLFGIEPKSYNEKMRSIEIVSGFISTQFNTVREFYKLIYNKNPSYDNFLNFDKLLLNLENNLQEIYKVLFNKKSFSNLSNDDHNKISDIFSNKNSIINQIEEKPEFVNTEGNFLKPSYTNVNSEEQSKIPFKNSNQLNDGNASSYGFDSTAPSTNNNQLLPDAVTNQNDSLKGVNNDYDKGGEIGK